MLDRRDIHKLVEACDREGRSWRLGRPSGGGTGVIVDAIPRRAGLSELEPIAVEFAALHDEVDIMLESFMNSMNLLA